MKIKSLLMMMTLLLGLTVGNMNAQGVELTHTQAFNDLDLGLWTVSVPITGSLYEVIGYDEDLDVNFDYTNDPEQSESGSFHFTGNDSDEDVCLISPQLSGTENGIHLSFYYTNFFEGASCFKVGYSTTSNDPEEFEWSDLIYAYKSNYWENNEEAIWEPFDSDFPVDVKYVAIAYPYPNDGGFNLYIDDIVITTTSCALPANFQVTGTTKNSISLSWDGYSDSYEIQHAPFQFFDFDDDESFYDNWQSVCDGELDKWIQTDFYDDIEGRHGTRCIYSDLEDYESNNYLVSPLMPMGGSISFYAMSQVPENSFKKDGSRDDEYYNTQFKVMVYVNDVLNELDESVLESDSKIISEPITAPDNWVRYTFPLDEYANYQEDDEGYVIICHINDVAPSKDEYYCYLLIDDLALIEPYEEAESVNEKEYSMENLDEQTYHAFRICAVEGNEHSSWTEPLYVKTLPSNSSEMPDYIFVNNGNWNVPSNWQYWYVPQSVEDEVTISANAVIPAGCVAKGAIDMNGGSITIQDGGQLMHNNADENITVTAIKRIAAYPAEGKAGYYLIASPNEMNPENVTNMLSNDYDLYGFNQSETLEWRNYKQCEGLDAELFLNPYEGYLYANSGNVILSFTGEIESSEEEAVSSLEYDNNAGFAGWNLVGNPFMCNAYIGRDFYRLGYGAVDATPAYGAIAPLEGVFVKAADGNDDEINFSREEPEPSDEGVLNVNVIRKEANVDVARVRFGEGEGLEKFQLNPNHTKVYFTQNGKNYAVVNTNGIDELPCNFKAEEDGTYTLSFTKEQVEFNYLHLIDNMTGADIDLLQQPEYTFQAKNDDYASRFRVVFVAKDAEGIAEDSETFAFNSYGSWIIVNEGLATLQMVDINGRMICNETIEGYTSMKFNVAPGVYVLRLVNGENVRVQKVVVR